MSLRASALVVGLGLTNVLAMPSLGAQIIYAPTTTHTYLELLNAYRLDDPAPAVAEFGRWPQTRISEQVILLKDDTEPWLRAAAAAFALEADLRSVQTIDAEPSNRSLRVIPMMPALLAAARRSSDPRLLRFCHDWFVAAGAMAARFRGAGYDTTGDVVRLGFDADPQILLLAAVNAEAQMGPLEGHPLGLGQLDTLKRGNFDHGLSYDAENLSRRALAADPALVEARLHLGRTLFQLSRDHDAQPELERALADATTAGKPAVAYLAAVFLGELHEEAGQPDDAERYYAQATAMQPLGAAGWLSLGRHRLSVGRADGWPTIAKMMTSPTGLSIDPWYLYFTPYYDELAPRLAALRATVRSWAH